MEKRTNNVQNILTKESIFTALMILMEKKDFKEISITEITKKAGVSRMAFYRNYDEKEDIIGTYLEELFKEYSKEILSCSISDDNNNIKNLRLYFSYFRKHEKLISNLIKSNLINMLLEKCIDSLCTLSRKTSCDRSYSPEKQSFWIEYMAGGLYTVLIKWAKGGMKENDEYMAEVISEFIHN
jgi:AcrR family transcriptional regulator